MKILLDAALERTLAMVADAVSEASEPWWIIGSAAVALHGAVAAGVRDVDLLMSAADAERVLTGFGLSSQSDSEHPLFRSRIFAAWREPPLPVEVFAEFSLATPEGWRQVALETREPAMVGKHLLFVPSAGELRELLLAFGRPKDLERARLLAAL